MHYNNKKKESLFCILWVVLLVLLYCCRILFGSNDYRILIVLKIFFHINCVLKSKLCTKIISCDVFFLLEIKLYFSTNFSALLVEFMQLIFSYTLWYPIVSERLANTGLILLSFSYPISYFVSVYLRLPYVNASGTMVFPMSISSTSAVL